VIENLIENKGADLAGRRFIDLHFWAFGEEAADKIALAFQTGLSPGSKKLARATPTLWSVETQLEATPLSVTAPWFVERMVRLAAEDVKANSRLGNISVTTADQQRWLAADSR